MKNLVFAISLILSFNVYAQNELKNTHVFVRVYDLQGNKIGKGKIHSISGTSLQLNRRGETLEIPVTAIGSIKTKRSAGHNVLIGAATGAVTTAILGAASADPGNPFIFGYTALEGAGIGVLTGGTVGAAVGGITVLFKKSKSYEIGGDPVKWKTFKETTNNQ